MSASALDPYTSVLLAILSPKQKKGRRKTETGKRSCGVPLKLKKQLKNARFQYDVWAFLMPGRYLGLGRNDFSDWNPMMSIRLIDIDLTDCIYTETQTLFTD